MTGYIAEMRKLVGHRTLMQCAASIICVDGKGRLLLGKRTDNHLWGYSGGSAEIDERIEDCARRELEEEMGLNESTGEGMGSGHTLLHAGFSEQCSRAASLSP